MATTKPKTAMMRPVLPAKPAWYLLVSRRDHFRLIGPFASNWKAAAWAERRKNNPDDDPRWQTIRLADAAAAVLVVAPDQPMPSSP